QRTMDLVYRRLEPTVFDELLRSVPRSHRRRATQGDSQRRIEDVGHVRLREHFIRLLTLMSVAETWEEFFHLLNKALPVSNSAFLAQFSADGLRSGNHGRSASN